MMRHQRKAVCEKKELGVRELAWAVVLAVILILLGIFIKIEFSRSLIVGSGVRSNLVLTSHDGKIAIVSFDPTEKKITEILFDDIAIKSRSVGEYKLSQLYALGNYEEKGGEFVRRKMQGFLRLPLTSYLMVDDITRFHTRISLLMQMWGKDNSAISRLDAMQLLFMSFGYGYQTVPFATLVSEGVVEKKGEEHQVSPTRLQQFVGTRFFDWRVGEEGYTATVLNGTKNDGLGSDVASFLTNVGIDVVAVRGEANNEKREKTQVLFAKTIIAGSASSKVLTPMFAGAEILYNQDLAEYRSDIVVRAGSDLLEMF